LCFSSSRPTAVIHTLSLHDALPICAEREPVAERMGHPGLIADVVSQVAQRVALLCAELRGDVLVAAREAHRLEAHHGDLVRVLQDRKSTRLNSSHVKISYAVFCLKK